MSEPLTFDQVRARLVRMGCVNADTLARRWAGQLAPPEPEPEGDPPPAPPSRPPKRRRYGSKA